MQISPRYDGPAVLEVAGVADPSVPLFRQVRRSVVAFGELTPEQWATPSRCAGWTARDVASHLATVFGFWAVSIQQGLAGEPTRFLDGFDPVASSAQLAEAERATPTAEVLDRLRQSTDVLDAALTGLDDAGWSVLAEAPPGHLPLRAVALHALWDSWVHERDVFLPLGVTPPEEPDEVLSALRYAAGLGPAFAAIAGNTRTGRLVIDVTDPVARITVEAGPCVLVRDGDAADGPAHITGRSVDVLEALSTRTELVADLAADDRWMLEGLATVFDQ